MIKPKPFHILIVVLCALAVLLVSCAEEEKTTEFTTRLDEAGTLQFARWNRGLQTFGY